MYRNFSTVMSAVLWMLLPKCSLCLVAYASIFSLFGLESVVSKKFTLPVIIILLAINVLSVIYLSIVKKEYTYALLSMSCAVIFIVNKIYIGSMAINIATSLVFFSAMLRARMFRPTKKDGVLKKEEQCCVANRK